MKLSHYELEELALLASGLTTKEIGFDINSDVCIDTFCNENFECSFDSFRDIVEGLIVLTPKIKSGLTGTVYHAFVKGDNAICKVEATDES